VNLRTIEYQKKNIGELLGQGSAEIVLGVFTDQPLKYFRCRTYT
jgi:hypothetical protein